MKNLVKLTLLAALLLCGSTTYAQKFGYVNSQELITAMPERDSALSKYQKFAQDQQSQLETIQVEFNNKYLDYQKNAETLSESANSSKSANCRISRNVSTTSSRLPNRMRRKCSSN